MNTPSVDPEFAALIPPLAEDELIGLEASIISDGCRDPLIAWAQPPGEVCEQCEEASGDKATEWDLSWRKFDGERGIYCDADPEDDGAYQTWCCPKCLEESALSYLGVDPEPDECILVDGHNRFSICTNRSINFTWRYKEFHGRQAAMLWMIDNQSHRRNLSDIDKISLARKREELLRPMAKEKYDATVGRPKKGKSKAKLPTINTRATAAKSAGVGERTYDAGKLILDAVEKGDEPEETLTKLRNRKASIHRVAKDIKERRQKQERQAKRTEAVKTAPSIPESIIVGDFRDHASKVADGTVSLIFTDPPYDKQATKMLPDLAAFAAAKLAEGGSLICYVGHCQLPAALTAFSSRLRYWWTIACIHSGNHSVIREYGIRAGWKPVLWFVKGTRHDNAVFVSDAMSGGEEKTHHDWQQSEAEAAYWIEKLTTPDGLVCDPFLGGGTTAAAAKALGRQWVGFEVDPNTAAIAAGRVS